MPDIHETAVVHPEARLDESVEVGPYAVIGTDYIQSLIILAGIVVVIDEAYIELRLEDIES